MKQTLQQQATRFLTYFLPLILRKVSFKNMQQPHPQNIIYNQRVLNIYPIPLKKIASAESNETVAIHYAVCDECTCAAISNAFFCLQCHKENYLLFFYIRLSRMYQEHRFYKIYRTLVVENQLNEKTMAAKVQLDVVDSYVILAEALKEARIQFEDKIVRIYDFQRNTYNIVQPQLKIPFAWISGDSCDLILVKLGTVVRSVTSISGSVSHEGEKLSQTSSIKKERSKERVIFEVIQIVKQWRELHQSKNSVKKMSLQEAAKSLGMPKKSLDDYYYQLRLGEKHGFDFQNHLFDRIGVLRTYLKTVKGHSNVDKYEKHPKNLRIMEKFQQISEMFYSGKNHSQKNTNLDMQQEMGEQNYINDDEAEEEVYQSEINNFKSEFQYLLDQKDPFLMGDYNFKKKMMEGLDSDQIFF